MKRGLDITANPSPGVYLVRHRTKEDAEEGFAPLAGRVRTLRASSAGRPCPTEMFLNIAGFSPVFPKRVLHIFDVGKALEPVVVGWMKEDGWEVRHNSDDSEGILIVLPGGFITGHIDILARHPEHTGNRWMLGDVKTMNDNRYGKWLQQGTERSNPGYFTQLDIYAHAYRTEIMGLVSVNKNDSQWDAEIMPHEPSRVLRTLQDLSELLEQDGFTRECDAYKCRYCSMKEICDAKAEGGPYLMPVPALKSVDHGLDLLADVFDLTLLGKPYLPTREPEECLRAAGQERKGPHDERERQEMEDEDYDDGRDLFY